MDRCRPRYKIGHVASQLGVTPNLLRAWERRYGFTQPARPSGKQRLYSEHDLARLGRVVELVRQGLTVGEVAALGIDALDRNEPFEKQASGGVQDAPKVCSEQDKARMEAIDAFVSVVPNRIGPRRYAGEGLEVTLQDLESAQSATVQKLYQILKGLYELWTYMEYQPTIALVKSRLKQLSHPSLRREVELLKTPSRQENFLLQAALEDASHGALPFLMKTLGEARLRQASQETLALWISLARDQAKILRNAFVDLDPYLREADEQLKAHALEPILTKVEYLQRSAGAVGVVTDFSGFITSRCLETSCLDRVLYRYLTEFRRHSDLCLLVKELANGWVRWSVQGKPGKAPLPSPGPFSALVIGKVANRSPQQALSEGYLGAHRGVDADTLWFHWPTYSPASGVPSCHCHPIR